MYVIDHAPANAAASRVLRCVKRSGTIHRDAIARTTGLSASTVSRALHTLLDLRLLRTRPDFIPVGPKGRPSIPVQIDPGHHLVGGIILSAHPGRLLLADLKGQKVWESPLPPELTAQSIAEALLHAADRLNRSLLSVGVLDRAIESKPDGHIATSVARLLGIPVINATEAHAGALAEHLLSGQGQIGKSVYFHVHNTAGYVVVIEEENRTVINDATSLSHFPTGSPIPCACGKTGCLAASVDDNALLAEMHGTAGPELLRQRGRWIAQAAGIVRDMICHDRLVFIGRVATEEVARDELIRTVLSSSVPSEEESSVRFGHLSINLANVAATTLALEEIIRNPETTGLAVPNAS